MTEAVRLGDVTVTGTLGVEVAVGVLCAAGVVDGVCVCVGVEVIPGLFSNEAAVDAGGGEGVNPGVACSDVPELELPAGKEGFSQHLIASFKQPGHISCNVERYWLSL